MTRFRLLAALALAALSTAGHAAEPTLPALSGRVVDEARVLSTTAHANLTEVLAEHERATSNQVVVATLRSLQGYEIEEFAVRLFRAWRLGHQDRNNGVLLLVAPSERRVRVEVGYGLEGALPDATAHAIVQYEILPRFRAGEMEDGIVRGTRAILGAIVGTYQPRSGKGFDPQYDKLLVILFGAFLMVILYNLYYRYLYYRDIHYRYNEPDPKWNSPTDSIYWPGRRYGNPGGLGGNMGGGHSSGGGFSGMGGSSGGGGASGRW